MLKRDCAITLVFLLLWSPAARSSDKSHCEAAVGVSGVPLVQPQISLREGSPILELTQEGFSVKVNVDSVFLNVAVQNRSTNQSIEGLKKEDFLVYEDGILQRVEQFFPSEAPLNLLLLLDVSGSAGFRLRLMKEASIDFIGKMKPNDKIALATFSSRVDLIQNFTNDRTRAEQSIQEIWAGGGTSFYDALMTCINEYMRGVEGRSAIVVFTDGVDNQLEGGYPAGSEATFDELYRRIQEAEPIIYTIFLDTAGVTGSGQSTQARGAAGGVSGGRRDPRLAPPAPKPDSANLEGDLASYDVAIKQLRAIADQTGGRMYSPRRIEELAGIYSEIARDLRVQYQLGYNPTNRTSDGRWREIRVKIKDHPEASVRTRRGYYARKEATAAP